MQWARKVMNDETTKIVQDLQPDKMNALEISGVDWKHMPWKTYKTVDYPDFDICKDSLPEEFDVVLAEQVWEHLPYPGRAVRNVLKMLKPGGTFMLTTPFMIKLHPYPLDCTRWTPTGMTFFLEECGFDRANIRSTAWGNRDCVRANFKGWPEYQEGNNITNEPKFPVVVWTVARKS